MKGDFNSWDGREHPMRQMGMSGVWELFVPDIGQGAQYKYDVLGADGVWREKADPLASYAEVPPATSSVVFESSYEWGDDEWMSSARGPVPTADDRSTRSTWLRGGGAAPTGRSPTSWSTTSTRPASPTSSSCR